MRPLLAFLLSLPLTAQSVTPVLVELFTSEGCSSCPPADNLLARLEKEQPVPGVETIVLSQHVDYWDQLGWRDPFSNALFTRRQSAYARSIGTGGNYTPQMVVDGKVEFVGSDTRRALTAITDAGKKHKLALRLTSGERTADAWTVHIDLDAVPESAEVLVALVDPSAASQVARGENGGRQLRHVAVVRSLTTAGNVAKGSPFSKDVTLKTTAPRQRAVVFTSEKSRACPGRRTFALKSKHMTKRVFLTIALAQALCFAQKADFSGSWTLNKAKSNFGSLPENMIPDSATRLISNTDSEMKMSGADTSSRGERAMKVAFKLDGSDSVNSQRGADVKTNAVWDGAAVVMKSKIDVGGSPLDMEERFSLSADRQVLFNDTKVLGTPIGDVVIKYAYDRVGAPAAAATASSASASPAFSGTWKMNVSKSNFGALPEEFRPTAITRVMTQDGGTLAMASEQVQGGATQKSTVSLKLDGTESVNQIMGAEVKSIAKMNGAGFEVFTKRAFGDMTLEVTEKNSLDANGNLVVDTQIGGTPMGVIVTKYIFEKQ